MATNTFSPPRWMTLAVWVAFACWGCLQVAGVLWKLGGHGIIGYTARHVVPTVLLIAFVVLPARHLRKSGQRARDQHASSILDSLKQGTIPRYSLYLRAFASTGQQSPDLFSEKLETPFVTFEDHRDFETVFAEAMEPSAPL